MRLNYNPLYRRMPSSGMWRRVDLVWIDVSEERIASIFRVQKSVSEEPAWAVGCSHQSVHTRSTGHHIPEDGILHSHRRENLKSYNPLCSFGDGQTIGLTYHIRRPLLFQWENHNFFLTKLNKPSGSEGWKQVEVSSYSFLNTAKLCASSFLRDFYLSLPVAPILSIVHPWNTSFHLSFLILDSR
jgi:hypothetical protein